LTTLRRVVFAALLLVFMLLAAVFAYSNPTPIDIDIGLTRLEQVSMSVAFAVVFAFGWLFGLISAGLALLQSAREKRRLKKDLKYVEAELSTLRGLPVHDAH
jgi:uncharacterized membrane protein YciS (DUF1049 family)